MALEHLHGQSLAHLEGKGDDVPCALTMSQEPSQASYLLLHFLMYYCQPLIVEIFKGRQRQDGHEHLGAHHPASVMIDFCHSFFIHPFCYLFFLLLSCLLPLC